MGVKLFQDDLFKYEGFELGNHVFEDLRDGTKISTSEAKFRIKSNNVTLLCQRDGKIDSTFNTRRTASKEDIASALSMMLGIQ